MQVPSETPESDPSPPAGGEPDEDGAMTPDTEHVLWELLVGDAPPEPEKA